MNWCNFFCCRYGFNSEGHDVVYDRLQDLRENKKFVGIVGVNLGKNKNSQNPVDDYVKGVQKFGSVADYLVINISRSVLWLVMQNELLWCLFIYFFKFTFTGINDTKSNCLILVMDIYYFWNRNCTFFVLLAL